MTNPPPPAPVRRARRQAGGVDFDRLRLAVDWSLRQLETPRLARVEAVRQYCGAHYASGASEQVVPTNFIELATTIYTRQLASGDPRVSVTSRRRELRPMAATFEAVLNQLPGELRLGEILRRSVLEALFSLAIVKVGLAADGEPFVTPVTLDGWFCDMSAKRRDLVQFEGDSYWLSLREARALFGAAADALAADPHRTRSAEGVATADSVSVDETADELEDRVELRDVYIHATGRLVTYAPASGVLLRDEPWDGPAGSPYVLLGFSDVPGNVLPLPPVALWRDLHELGNKLFRRLGKQADARKTVAAFAGGNADDVQRLRQARDGDGISYNGPKPEMLSLGGVDQGTLAFYMQVRDLFGYFAGNLDSLGGLGASAETATQERLLAAAGSARVAAMADRVRDFAREIFRRLAWYCWTDPVRRRRYEKPVRGTDLVVSGDWTPETRDGDFLDYNLEIDVHSMQDNSPEARLRRLAEVFQQFLLPLAPDIQAQGGRIDLARLLRYIGENAGLPELDEFVDFSGAAAGAGGPQEGALPPEVAAAGGPRPYRATMNHNGPREYVRRDVGAASASQSGRDAALLQALSKGAVQQ